MKSAERTQWITKTQRLNKDKELTIGAEVIDLDQHKGIVVKIENDTVYVWQSERTDYGSDNCEHYHLEYWKEFLRILK